MSTYSQLHIHIIFGVKGRASLIQPEWEEELYKYITGIIKKKGHKMLAINGMPDHIHLFIGLEPEESISSLVREIKKSSNQFINNDINPKTKFAWQEGFGVFSYSQSQAKKVVNYVLNQKQHHKNKSFHDEYLQFLSKFKIEYNPKYFLTD